MYLTPIAQKIVNIFNDTEFKDDFEDILFKSILYEDYQYDYLSDVNSIDDAKTTVDYAIEVIVDKSLSMGYFFENSIEILLENINEDKIANVLWKYVSLVKGGE